MVDKIGSLVANSPVNKKDDDIPPSLKNYKAKEGDTPASLYKLFNFKTEKDFRKYAGLSDTAQIKTGTEIKVPTKAIETTFAAISREYNMSMADLKQLNPQLKDLNNIAKNAPINVPSKPFEKVEKVASKVEPESNIKAEKPAPQTSEELAADLKTVSNRTAAVGKPQFNALFEQLSKNNIENVIKEYDKISPKKSLIDMICSEWGSPKEGRMNAVSKIFDLVAEKKGAGVVPESTKADFNKELQDQFNSFGFVSTEKLDDIINKALGKTPASNLPQKDTSQKVILGSGKTFTLEKLRKDALNSGKKEIADKFETFRRAEARRLYGKDSGREASKIQLDLSRVKRPLPVIDEDNRITTEVSAPLPPTNPKGDLKGKVFLVNAGHGGYQTQNGYFDPGALSFAKDASGKYVPVQEYEITSRYTDDLIDKLRSNGATVVRIQGTVNTMSAEKVLNNLIEKHGKSNTMFIALHADSNENKTGSGILYNPHDSKDTLLSKHLLNTLNGEEWISAETTKRPSYNEKSKKEENNLHVLNSTKGLPSTLLEIEYLSGTKQANLNSSAFQQRFLAAAMKGIQNYYTPKGQ